jgi:phage gp36-like protein
MSNFIEKEDYDFHIRTNRLDEILDQDDSILHEAELSAIATVEDALHRFYDSDAIFATTGNDRPKSVMRWVINLVMYHIYERVADNLVPERIVKNYNDTLALLEDVATGKRSVKLQRIASAETAPNTQFRGGGQKARPSGY